MSSFIEMGNRLHLMQTSGYNLIDGHPSRIIRPSFTHNQIFRQLGDEQKRKVANNISFQFQKECDEAIRINDNAILGNYTKVVKDLWQYGKDGKFKTESIFNEKLQEKEQFNLSDGERNKQFRVVVMEKKYSNEFGLKLACMKEVSEMSQQKNNLKKCLDRLQSSVLIEKSKNIILKIRSQRNNCKGWGRRQFKSTHITQHDANTTYHGDNKQKNPYSSFHCNQPLAQNIAVTKILQKSEKDLILDQNRCTTLKRKKRVLNFLA